VPSIIADNEAIVVHEESDDSGRHGAIIDGVVRVTIRTAVQKNLEDSRFASRMNNAKSS
jgi:hypothetical protein